MRLLLIHADSFSYEAKEKTSLAEPCSEEMKKGSFAECLVVFTAVEESDEKDPASSIKEGVLNIIETAERLNVQKIIVYPYAHLSSSLASGYKATKILTELANELSKSFPTHKAPFGWYKSFSIQCKGHPLSELSKQITPKSSDKEKLSEKPAVKREDVHIILDPSGKEYEVSDFLRQDKGSAFETMVKKEALKIDSPLHLEPDYLRLCKKFGIEWEAMSDHGHMRFGPKGALMFDLLADYSLQNVYKLGLPIFTVHGTNMFNMNERPVSEHAELFGGRLYTLKDKDENKEFVLRYAACHQQFAMIKNWNISYRHLPFGAFEIADSYRYEQSGECMLCFRTRRMNMPDCHIFCKDTDEALAWFTKVHNQIYEQVYKLDRDYEMLVNYSSKKAYQESKDFLTGLLKEKNKPALIHFYPEGINYYWTMNIEYHILDCMARAREIGTIQIDTGNAKRFGITYTEKEEKKYPIILHLALVGTLERHLYLIFDTAIELDKKGKGSIPLWLNPEQVRIIPTKEVHIELAQEISRLLEKANLRVGIDDRNETLSRKVRQSRIDWVGYEIVIGDKEKESNLLSVYRRQDKTNYTASISQLTAELSAQCEGLPYRPLYFPRELSKRPQDM